MRQRIVLDRLGTTGGLFEIAKLDADHARGDEGLLEMTARLAAFEFDDEALACATASGKLGLGPAKRFSFCADQRAKI